VSESTIKKIKIWPSRGVPLLAPPKHVLLKPQTRLTFSQVPLISPTNILNSKSKTTPSTCLAPLLTHKTHPHSVTYPGCPNKQVTESTIKKIKIWPSRGVPLPAPPKHVLLKPQTRLTFSQVPLISRTNILNSKSKTTPSTWLAPLLTHKTHPHLVTYPGCLISK
jgi:hypothetical protein